MARPTFILARRTIRDQVSLEVIAMSKSTPVRVTVSHRGRAIATKVVTCPESERQASRDRFRWQTAHTWATQRMQSDYQSSIIEVLPGESE